MNPKSQLILDTSIKPAFGLMIVKLLVDEIDGTLRLKRENGSCFEIEFPIDMVETPQEPDSP